MALPTIFPVSFGGDDEAVLALDQSLQIALFVVERAIVEIGKITKHLDPELRELRKRSLQVLTGKR